MKHIMSVSLGEDTVAKIQNLLRKGKYRNKSHIVEEAIIEFFERGGKDDS
ncbi:ribbon-helix-helix protein, CopG family [Candidatus Woesearchaeota archaeon]|nr:ribbon-helix-helix protein, CopG family [Candidatus Woesearchaeota archaeon]